jgi:acetylglutamate kinase
MTRPTARVIKVGGRPQRDPALVAALVAAQRAHTGALVVMHGGGDEVGALQRLYGVDAQFVGGRRLTSALDLDLIRMALSGAANKRLVSALVSAGVQAVGLSGEDAGLLRATALDLDRYGYVGTPAAVHVALLHLLLDAGYLPVLSPVSRGEGETPTLNVNGDDAAAAVAVALGASELLLVSDVEGVRVRHATVAALGEDDARALVASGEVGGGMAAKLEAALAALEGGVERVRISDIAAIESVDRGTVLTRVGSVCT